MIIVSGYKLFTKIYESANSLVYQGYREPDNLPAIIKILKQEYPSPQELIRYKQEYKIISSLVKDNIIRAEALEKYQNTLAIVFEDFGGKSLDICLNEYQFTIAKILELAIKITSGLETIHAANIIHKDINPSNIVFNPQTSQIKIIDFGISTVLARENPIFKNPDELEGTLAYISPEQTGRMNRFLDRRSDFYSLGVTLYELLTKQLPFKTENPLGLIHSHIALNPTPPRELKPEIPQLISDIVMKLLAKNAEDRYQSAWGLKADLIASLKQINTNISLDNFVLGQKDFSERFEIYPKLYGRQKEITQLLISFERVKSGKKEIYLVAGSSGVGKTTLVNEVRKLILQQRGYFVSGKFEQYKRDIPYFGFISAFENLIEQLLSETESQLEVWKQKLLEALGDNGQLIVDLIGKIELIIGSQPALELGVNEAENRFNLVLQRFIGVFTTQEHPLVIFLDDLQWADSASLKLIKLLINNPEIEYLLLIGSYRDNEVDRTHFLTLICQEIEETGIDINKIFLKPLRVQDIEELICDSFSCLHSDSQSLAELLLNKTNGNPFFLNQLLQYLHQHNLISFNYKLRTWQWDINEIKAIAVTDNVLELTSGKIARLNKNTQNVLKLAACIGNNFSLEVLSIVNKKSISVTAKELLPAMESGLILPANNNYKFPLLWENDTISVPREEILAISYNFLHDRIQQAAYALIPEVQKKDTHRQVGQLLLQNIKTEELEENIFDIVNQLNISKELITQRSELDELARLNLIAGKQAKASAAYETALKHLQIGIELLTESHWVDRYELSLSLYLEGVEAAYLNGKNFDLMNNWGDRVLEKAKTLLDCVKVYQIKILANVGQNNSVKAIETGLSILKQLGVNLPKNPSKFQIFFELLSIRLSLNIKLALTGKQIKDLIELPLMTDPDKIGAMEILIILSSATYFANQSLALLLVLRTVKLAIEYGNTASSASTYAVYAWILSALVKDFDSGYQFAQLALNLSKKLKNKKYKSKTIFDVNIFIMHGVKHIKITLPNFLEAYQIALETGDIQYACYSLDGYFTNSYLIGKELMNLENKIAEYSKQIEIFQQETGLNRVKMIHQILFNLINKEKNLSSLAGPIYDEKKMLGLHEQAKDKTTIFYLYFHKLYLAYLFGEYERAIDYAARAEQNLDGVLGLIFIPQYYFYDSLIKIALFSENSQKYKHFLKHVTSNQKEIKQWAARAPMNYQHKSDLLAAEFNRIKGNNEEAVNLYQKAIASAKKQEYIHEEALAWELAAKFYLEWDKATIAKTYIKEAHYRYQLWGAIAKVKQLEEQYSELLSQNTIAKSKTDSVSFLSGKDTTKIKLKHLDLNIILETDRAISQEKNLEKLLSTIVRFASKNVGAETGTIILNPKLDNLVRIIKVIGGKTEDQTDNKEIIFVSFDEASQEFSQSIVNYVERSKEIIILGDAVADKQFVQDPYIFERQVKSVLCLPLISFEEECIGSLYLENNLSTNVFREDGIEVLKVIVNRGMMAIENAILKKKKSYVSGYYQLGVSLSADAPSYVERDADRELYENLRRGNYCYILNARQMGKSSLRVRITHRLKSEGYRCALVDISSIRTEQVTRAAWYKSFLRGLVRDFPELDTPDLKKNLKDLFAAYPDSEGLKYFIEEILLPKVKEKIVIFLEEIDSIRKLSFPLNDFFAQIRYFGNFRADRPELKRISFVLIGATTPTDLIDDPDITPFNVGTKIRLSGLKLEDSQPLIDGFKNKCKNPQVIMKQILAWTGGQPFLTQRLCSLVELAETNAITGKEAEWIARLVETEVVENWQEKDRTDHLKNIQKCLLKNKFSPPKNLLELYKYILLGQEIIFDFDRREQEELLIIGIVKVENNKLKIFNQIYQSIFDIDWVQRHLKLLREEN